MSLPKKIKKEDIVKAALEIIKTENLDDLTARRLAEALNCSVQPIFYNFATMDELKALVLDTIYQIYKNYMDFGAQQPQPYKGMGIAYVRFARDYPNYFRIIFMSKTDLTAEDFISKDSVGQTVLKHGMAFTGLDYEAQKQFHLKVWIFTHGLASLVASGTARLDDVEVDALLTNTVREMIAGYKHLTKESKNA